MQQHRRTFAGIEAMAVSDGLVEVLVATSVGPRILGLQAPGGPQLFASLPEARLEREGASPFRFYGGHRLWVAPEVPALTYAPDDEPVTITVDDDSVTISGVVDDAGWEKTIIATLASGCVVVDHVLANGGHGEQTVAAWAITQLAVGGTAILPLGVRASDPYQPDRSIVAWPYTRWDDPMVAIHDRHIEVEATRSDPTKVGTALRREWMAYRLGGHLFVKRSRHPEGVALPDLGASAQCYCNQLFLELESLGPLTAVPAGGTLRHREVWEIHEVDHAADLSQIAAALDLDRASPHLEDD